MGRAATGFSVRWRGPTRGWYVRFRVHGQRVDKSTGIKDRRAKSLAQAEARAIYAAHIRGEQRTRAPSPAKSEDLYEVTDQWLDSLSVRPVTRELYAKYAGYWVDRWETLGELTSAQLELYKHERLRIVRGKSVANELSAMRRMFEWCVHMGKLEVVPEMPTVSKASGTPYKKRTRTAAPELEPSEVWALINALPELSRRGRWPVRARAIVAYATSLRPETLSRIRVPEHYSLGARVLRVTDDIDKEGAAREVPLSPEAMSALDSVCPDVGLIFGSHRLDPYLQMAAHKTLPPHKAAIFTGQHFRSAALTHMLEASSNLAGAQYMAGHSDAKTTSRYVRPSFRAAEDVLQAWGKASIREPRAGARKRRK